MNLRVEVVSVGADGRRARQAGDVYRASGAGHGDPRHEPGGSKTLLEGVQDFMIAQQVEEDLERQRDRSHCDRRHAMKEFGTRPKPNIAVTRCNLSAGLVVSQQELGADGLWAEAGRVDWQVGMQVEAEAAVGIHMGVEQ